MRARQIGIDIGTLASVAAKGHFSKRTAALALNERQIKTLNRLLDGVERK